MIDLTIPGRGNYKIKHLVCDVNGTLAFDGVLYSNVALMLKHLSDRVTIHILTANTHGKQDDLDRQIGVKASIIDKGNEAQQKADYVINLDSSQVIAIGQGANDAMMLKEACIGIGILSEEGLAIETLINADLVVPDIQSALGLLENPLRLVATLRK